MKALGFSEKTPRAVGRRAIFLAVAVGFGAAGFAGAAYADCQEDIAKMNERRMAQIGALNASAKKLKGKLNPVTACPQLRSLAATERQIVAYMEKNKEWCSIPDDAISNVKQSAAKTGGVAGQACAAIGQMKKMQEMQRRQQEQQAQGGFGYHGPQKLPTGPL
jgi:hypothetical protein